MRLKCLPATSQFLPNSTLGTKHNPRLAWNPPKPTITECNQRCSKDHRCVARGTPRAESRNTTPCTATSTHKPR
eukprot:9093659-Lingulodinium_polyedra.AAC.1